LLVSKQEYAESFDMQDWFHIATHLPAPHLANDMAHNNNSRKIVMHFTEGNTGLGQARNIAQYVIREKKNYHMVIDLTTGEYVQIVPASGGSRSLLNGGINNGVGCNRSGELCVQIAICGKTSNAKTIMAKAGHHNWNKLVQWADTLQIPRINLSTNGRNTHQWNLSGWADHYSAPGNNHTDGLHDKTFLATIPFNKDRKVNRYKITAKVGAETRTILNRDGYPADHPDGWTLNPNQAKEFPEGRIRDENIPHVANWINRKGYTITSITTT
jgi:hypothetical protein